MTTIIPTLRTEIEARLGELQAESDTLRNALSALADNGAGKETVTAIGATPQKPPEQPRQTRVSAQALILAELERVAPERLSAQPIANTTGLNRSVVSTTLSKLAGAGVIEPPVKRGEGYRVKGDVAAAA